MDDEQHTIGIETYNKNRIIYMNKYLVIFLIYIVLASCQKAVIQNYTPKPQDYVGTWEHDIWINDTIKEDTDSRNERKQRKDKSEFKYKKNARKMNM